LNRALVAIAVSIAAALTGCGSLDVTPEGILASPIAVAAVSTDDRVVLTCDHLGNLTVNGRALELPSVREDARLGLRLADVTWLPPVWRPKHAKRGGYLVTRLHKASPLALRGLRPLDLVTKLNGEPLEEVEVLTRRLRDSRRREVLLEGLHPDGREFSIRARADERVGASTQVHVPFVFERRHSSLGEAFACGPLDTLFHWRSRRNHTYVDDSSQGHSQYSEDFEWGALANLLGYRRRRDPLSGEEKIQFTVFWVLSFGDDL
jgi:hypothetical protein